MRSMLTIATLAALLPAFGAGTAEACYRSAARHRCCKRTCCDQQFMKTCREVVYEEQERTFYKTVYKEVVDEKKTPAVEYVEETRYRCQPCTTWQSRPCRCGAPADACAPECGSCGQKCEMAPVKYIRKVPYTVVVPKQVTKVEKVPRVVITQEPYTVTECVPHVICKQVPVTICCPTPSCCRLLDLLSCGKRCDCRNGCDGCDGCDGCGH